jgi:hypothetical protein
MIRCHLNRHDPACEFRIADSPTPSSLIRLQGASSILPLTHAVNLARPLLNGAIPVHIALDIAVLLACSLEGFYISLAIFRKHLAQ